MGPLPIVVGLLVTFCVPAAASVPDDIAAALAQVGALKVMQAGRTYSLTVGTEAVAGTHVAFLSRREPEEVLSSGLSSGCGDHAAAFYGLLRAKGVQDLKYIEAVELSVSSLLERFSGHAAVAVKDPASDSWVLVDPINGKVVSERWDPAAKVLRTPAGRFWIGYAGRLEDYPVKSPEQLKKSFRRGLRAVPVEDWDREVVRLDIGPGPSMSGDAGSFANKNFPAFRDKYSGIYDELGVRPRERVSVAFTDGGPGYAGDCKRTRRDAWECSVGRDAAMDQTLFVWVERSNVMRQVDSTFP